MRDDDKETAISPELREHLTTLRHKSLSLKEESRALREGSKQILQKNQHLLTVQERLLEDMIQCYLHRELLEGKVLDASEFNVLLGKGNKNPDTKQKRLKDS